MDLEKRFCEIRDFLSEFQYLHELEVMERYPYPLKDPYQKWSEVLLQLSDVDIIALECFGDTSSIQKISKSDATKGLTEYFKKAWKLSSIPKLEQSCEKIPQHLSRKMSQKKVHEVSSIHALLSDKQFSQIIDVGSGAGHLSSILVHDRELKSFCVDMNKEFQEQGVKKLKRWNPELLDKIEFIHFELKKQKLLPFAYKADETLVIGLHSCGPLSTYLVENQAQNFGQKLLNFGCCYHKLTNEYKVTN